MTFGAPGYLALLAPVALAALALLAWMRWRTAARARFGAAPDRGGAPVVSLALLLVAAAFAAFAAARPQFGDEDARVQDRGIDFVAVLDVSQSMLATDAEPSRLARAQAELIALLERMDGDRAGLVIFAGQTFVRSPISADLAAVARIVEGVDRERGLVDPGSDLGAAITEAHTLLSTGRADTRAMLIISDGEDHRGGISEALAAARRDGIRIYSAGAGTATGAPVLDIDRQTGATAPRLGPDGSPVLTRLDEDALRGIAGGGGGRYIALAGEGRPLASLAAEFDSLAATTFAEREAPARTERFQPFAAVALAAAALAMLLPAFGAAAARGRTRAWPLLAGGLLAGAICAGDAAESNRRGNDRYAAEDYDGAIAAYATAAAQAPGRGEAHYNAGNAFNRKGEFASAIEETRRALPSGERALVAKAEYALGNHHVASGDLREAAAAYKRALLADPGDADAKHNLELVLAMLSPTPAAPTPTPSAEPGEGEGENGGGEGSATPGAATPGAGTPGASGTPAPDQPAFSTPQPGGTAAPPPAGVQRTLEEALAGIDEEFTLEEALEVLDALEERNRGQLASPPGPGNARLPDY